MLVKVALFDFDNTLASGDTIHRLMIQDIKKHPLHLFYFIKTAISFIKYKCHLCEFELVKNTLLFPLKYMNEHDLKLFYTNHVIPYYYQNVVDELIRLKNDGYHIIICTASSEIYMKYCDLPIDVMIGTRLDESHKIIGKNCRKKEKIPRIQEYLESKDLSIDYDQSIGFTDSNDDIYMLSLVKNRRRVLLKTGEIVEFKE